MVADSWEPEYWQGVSETARDFVRACLTVDPTNRPTAAQLLQHKWLRTDAPPFVADPESESGAAVNLLPTVKKAFDAKKTCEFGTWSYLVGYVSRGANLALVRRAVLGMMAVHRLQDSSHAHGGLGPSPAEKEKLQQEVAAFKKEAEAVSGREHGD